MIEAASGKIVKWFHGKSKDLLLNKWLKEWKKDRMAKTCILSSHLKDHGICLLRKQWKQLHLQTVFGWTLTGGLRVKTQIDFFYSTCCGLCCSMCQLLQKNIPYEIFFNWNSSTQQGKMQGSALFGPVSWVELKQLCQQHEHGGKALVWRLKQS